MIFSIENTYAVNIGDIKEIIDFPERLMQPPGLPKHFRGVLNLRGELVTIVDARALYSVEPSLDPGPRKVLVFKKNDVHFGLVVDSVESIASFTESEKIKRPSVLYRQEGHRLTQDMSEAVEIHSGMEQRRSLLILDAQSLASRVKNSLVAA